MLLLVKSANLPAHAESKFRPSPRLQKLVDHTESETLAKFAAKKLEANQFAITLVDLRDPDKPEWASFRGGEQIYPASVIKMFYLIAAHRWMEDGRLKDSEELRRAMRDMIVDSLTGTTSGSELPPDELENWHEKRNVANRYFASLGYQNINVNRKPWCEGPYGREMQSVKLHKPNHRNWLTTEATARLLVEIATGKSVTHEMSLQMMELLHRRPFDKDSDVQSREYTGVALPAGANLRSKAGWTSEVRHDAAYVELPGGSKFVVQRFSE